MPRTNRWLWTVSALATLVGCSASVDKSTTYWEDEFCHPGNPPPPPFSQTAFVGLFLEDGTPLCRDDATVTLAQDLTPPREDHRSALVFSSDYFARVTDEWAMRMFSGGDGPCNVYAPPVADYHWERCNPTLQYEVRVEGCEPVSGNFTWNDNWFAWKASFEVQDWFVPVRMRCGVLPDASVPMDASGASDGSAP